MVGHLDARITSELPGYVTANLTAYLADHLQDYIDAHLDAYINDNIGSYVSSRLAARVAADKLADEADLATLFHGIDLTAKHANFSYIQDTPAPGSTYLFTSNTLAASLRGGVKVWSESELVNALGAGVTKRVTDTQVTHENNNVDGADVTLTAHKDIGTTTAPTVIHLTPGTAYNLNDDERAALGAAERQDIVYLS
eukprot:gene7616-10163_t